MLYMTGRSGHFVKKKLRKRERQKHVTTDMEGMGLGDGSRDDK